MRTLTVTDGNYDKIRLALQDSDEDITSIRQVVSEIISEVRSHGDEQLIALTNRFDRNNLTTEQLKITPDQIEAAYRTLSTNTIKALELASVRIHSYYEKLKPQNLEYTDKTGVDLGARWVPVESVGLYVPGGKAAYPSSVLMNAVPARVAGVGNIIMVTPAPDGFVNPSVLAAAKICGITEIYQIGGAQAVAALAYGTQTIPAVNKIFGPGNAYVAEAKRQVFGKVGIDMIAGPSDICVIADEKNDPYHIAADLLSQAEHDETARSILITASQSVAQKIVSCVYEILPKLERYEIARASIEKNGLVIVTNNIDEAVFVANMIAPEHLELAVEKPLDILPKIINAGAIFLGRWTPEAIGDYLAGPSHVLPTMGSAKFSSGLSVTDFMKRQSIIGCDKKSFKALAQATALLATTEGLGAHALSVTIRNGK